MTMSTLMAALMVRDLHQPWPTGPSPAGWHPEERVAEGAVHGGYWRRPYDLRSTLVYTGLLGLPEGLRPHPSMTTARTLSALLALLSMLAFGAPAVDAARPAAACGDRGWVGAWATAPSLPGSSYTDQTVRVVVNPHRGGRRLRLRLSNRFGTGSLTVDRVTVARRRSDARVVAGSLEPVTFRGRGSVTIPRGADVFSNPVRLRFRALAYLAISMYLRGPSGPSGPATVHPIAKEIGSYTAARDRTEVASGTSFGSPSQAWPLLTGVEVQAPRRVRTLVALGDSITDGFQSAVAQRPGERNTPWPDFLARRLDRRGSPFQACAT